jgi:RNA polymerase sigma-32 factor
MASRLSGYGIALDDLVAAGNVGLVVAADKFDPALGNRFATYASWWIRSSMQDYVLRNWSLVRATTTGDRRQLFFSLRRMKRERGETGFGDMAPETVAEIAEALGTSEGDVVEMNRYLSGTDLSPNRPVGEKLEDEWCDFLEDESPDPESTVIAADELRKRRALMHDAMQVLNERERHILTERRLKDEPLTLGDLSDHYGISRERVRQIEVRAWEKLQKAVLRGAKSSGMPHALAA